MKRIKFKLTKENKMKLRHPSAYPVYETWITSDGKEFEFCNQARYHEIVLKLRKLINRRN